jgi:nitrous oxide reductase accessory protein NosL
MRALLAFVAVLAPAAALGQQAQDKPPAKVTLYKTADSAACSGDVAVWVDPKGHVYYQRGDSLFGKTRPGGYNCRKQVEAAGYKPARPR